MAEKEYIEREAVLKQMAKIKYNFSPTVRPMFDIFEHIMHQTPIADVIEVVHGEWILHMDGSGTCKRCGVTQKLVWDVDNWQNYCGHCGAKMDGGKVR